MLTEDIDTEDNMPSADYAGVYRQWLVLIGLHSYMPSAPVPSAIWKLEQSLKTDTKAKYINSIDLAGKYCHPFVYIYSFADDNGWIYRLILNVLLLKYGGVFFLYGGDGEV